MQKLLKNNFRFFIMAIFWQQAPKSPKNCPLLTLILPFLKSSNFSFILGHLYIFSNTSPFSPFQNYKLFVQRPSISTKLSGTSETREDKSEMNVISCVPYVLMYTSYPPLWSILDYAMNVCLYKRSRQEALLI